MVASATTSPPKARAALAADGVFLRLDYGLGLAGKRRRSIRKQEDLAGRFRPQSVFTVVLLQNAVIPVQQIRIRQPEFPPSLALAGTRHSFLNQQNVRPCNRLVVQPRLAVRRSVTLERLRKSTEHIQHWTSAQIQKYDLYVDAVTETVEGQRTVLELPNQVVVVIIAQRALPLAPLDGARAIQLRPSRTPAESRRRIVLAAREAESRTRKRPAADSSQPHLPPAPET